MSVGIYPVKFSRLEELLDAKEIVVSEVIQHDEWRTVFLGTDASTNTPITISVFVHNEIGKREYFRCLDLLQHWAHPHLPKLLGAQVEPDILIYFTSTMPGINLGSFLESSARETFSDEDFLQLLEHIYSIMCIASETGVVPRRISSRHIFLEHDGHHAVFAGLIGVEHWLPASTFWKYHIGNALHSIDESQQYRQAVHRLLKELHELIVDSVARLQRTMSAELQHLLAEISRQLAVEKYDFHILFTRAKELQGEHRKSLATQAARDMPAQSFVKNVFWGSTSFQNLWTKLSQQARGTSSKALSKVQSFLSVFRATSPETSRTESGSAKHFQEQRSSHAKRPTSKQQLVFLFGVPIFAMVLFIFWPTTHSVELAGDTQQADTPAAASELSADDWGTDNEIMDLRGTDEANFEDGSSFIKEVAPDEYPLALSVTSQGDGISVADVHRLLLQAQTTVSNCVSEESLAENVEHTSFDCIKGLFSETSPVQLFGDLEIQETLVKIIEIDRLPEQMIQEPIDFGDMVMYQFLGLTNESASHVSIVLERFHNDWLIRNIFIEETESEG